VKCIPAAHSAIQTATASDTPSHWPEKFSFAGNLWRASGFSISNERGLVIMKLLISALTALLLAAVSLAQSPAQSNGAAEAQNGGIRLAPGTIIRVELAKTLDAKKAKVGDEVIAKTMDDFRSDKNEVLAPRGSKILGHVAEVSAHEHDSTSTLGIAFDKMVLKNGTEIPLKASIQAIGWPQSNTASAYQPMGSPSNPAPVPTSGNAGSAPGMQVPSGSAAGNVNGAPPMPEGTDATGGYGQLTAKDQGVVGMSGVSLSTGAAEDSLLSSPKHNVKLDSGTQMILRVIS
jgi:hypothetical protein